MLLCHALHLRVAIKNVMCMVLMWLCVILAVDRKLLTILCVDLNVYLTPIVHLILLV